MKKFRTAAHATIVAIMAVIMCLNTAPIFAAEATTTAAEMVMPTLTLEDATVMAIKNSGDIKALNDNKEAYEESADSAKDTLFSSDSSASYINYTVTMNAVNFNRAMNEQNIAKREALIAQSVSSAFSAIDVAETSYEEYLAGLEIAKTNFNITEVKKNLGMISELDYMTAKQDYDTTVAAQESYEQNIIDANVSLNRMIGKDADERYKIVFEVSYTELGSFDLAHHINLVKDADSTIKSINNDIDDANYSLETYTRQRVNDATGEITEGGATRESYKRTLSQKSLELTERRDAIEDGLTEMYNAIIEQEKSYREQTSELANLNKQYEVKKVEMELGKITQLELDTLAYNIQQKENDIAQLIYEHQDAVTTFTDVNLASGSIQ